MFQYVPDVIREAARSTLGVLALMVLLLAVIAYKMFRHSREPVRIGIFLTMLAGAVAFGSAILDASRGPDPASPIARDDTQRHPGTGPGAQPPGAGPGDAPPSGVGTAGSPQPSGTRPAPQASTATPRSTIVDIPLRGEPRPVLLVEGSTDPLYSEAKEVIADAIAAKGGRLDRLEVVKWTPVPRESIDPIIKQMLHELGSRASYNYSPTELAPLDPRRRPFWRNLNDLDVMGPGRLPGALGYFGVGMDEGGRYTIVWAWALVS